MHGVDEVAVKCVKAQTPSGGEAGMLHYTAFQPWEEWRFMHQQQEPRGRCMHSP
jgi:hypothetical protein